MARRSRLPALLALAAAALLLFACGGGSTPAAPASAVSGAGLLTPTPTPPQLATPTPIPETASAVTVSRGAKVFTPTVAEFKALPVVEIDAGGKKSGVTIGTLGEKVGATNDSVVTIQGVRADGRSIAFVRKRFEEISATTILLIDDKGHLSVASTSLDKAEWLQAVVAVNFAP